MKRAFYILSLGLFISLYACDTIDEVNRFKEMDEVIPQKNVFVMDFTDQLCINCPEAAMIIDTLQGNYGDAVIAVSIHSSSSKLSLVTDEGKEYDKHFGIDYTHPNAVIDGLGVYQKDLWRGTVLGRFNVQSKINLDLNARYNVERHEIEITSTISNADLSANLKYQLWVVEDSIIDYQKIGSKATDYNYAYVHNHVFRTSVNGTWGENLLPANVTEGKPLNHTFAVNEAKLVPKHLSIVGFISNASSDEVYEVKRSHVELKSTK